jgi:EAL domain-containing protein (putative c-di-GMP-specific phosphodiesterase class I)
MRSYRISFWFLWIVPFVLLVIESITLMAHKLGMDVIAEGVETAEELEFLRNHVGCEQIQGFLISPAVAPEEISQRLYEQRLPAPFPTEDAIVSHLTFMGPQ